MSKDYTSNNERRIFPKDFIPPNKKYMAYLEVSDFIGHIENGNDIAIIETIKQHICKIDTAKCEYKLISHCVFICTDDNWEIIIQTVSELQNALMSKAVYLMGGLCFGEVYIDNDFICGKGLVEAVDLAYSTKKAPKIIIDESFIRTANQQFLANDTDKSTSSKYYSADSEGSMYITHNEVPICSYVRKNMNHSLNHERAGQKFVACLDILGYREIVNSGQAIYIASIVKAQLYGIS